MRAAYYEKNGAAKDVFTVGDVETPKPGPGEVRVRLAVSGVNPSDVKTRSGATRKIVFPRVIPHSDGAGEIDAVGDGVPSSRIGERVWIWNGAWKRPFGTAAQYIALPAEQAVTLPKNASMEAGATLGIPAFTGWQVVDLAGAASGMTILVQGGAGAVGHYAIQFAKARGATVIATVSSAAKAGIAREAGADHTIDYKAEDVGARVKEITGGRGADATLDVLLDANAPLWPQVLRPKGTAVIYGTGAAEAKIPAGFMLQNGITAKFTLVYEMERADRLRAAAEINALLERGALKSMIDKSFGLDEIVAAHEAMEAGTAVGKIIVRL